MINKIIITIIVFYQRYYSAYRPPVCRFVPSCSNFALEAFKKYHFFTAVKFTFFRLLRCGPWCLGGYDPVP